MTDKSNNVQYPWKKDHEIYQDIFHNKSIQEINKNSTINYKENSDQV